jgi:hypothetical protein
VEKVKPDRASCEPFYCLLFAFLFSAGTSSCDLSSSQLRAHCSPHNLTHVIDIGFQRAHDLFDLIRPSIKHSKFPSCSINFRYATRVSVRPSSWVLRKLPQPISSRSRRPKKSSSKVPLSPVRKWQAGRQRVAEHKADRQGREPEPQAEHHRSRRRAHLSYENLTWHCTV